MGGPLNSLQLRWKLEILYVCTDPYVVSENIPFSIKAFLILLMSGFLWKKSAFFGQDNVFTQSNSKRAVLKIF